MTRQSPTLPRANSTPRVDHTCPRVMSRPLPRTGRPATRPDHDRPVTVRSQWSLLAVRFQWTVVFQWNSLHRGDLALSNVPYVPPPLTVTFQWTGPTQPPPWPQATHSLLSVTVVCRWAGPRRPHSGTANHECPAARDSRSPMELTGQPDAFASARRSRKPPHRGNRVHFTGHMVRETKRVCGVNASAFLLEWFPSRPPFLLLFFLFNIEGYYIGKLLPLVSGNAVTTHHYLAPRPHA